MPQQEIAIGDISSLATPFATEAAQDGLSMRFILAVTIEDAIGDYNSDGLVDAADYTVWRDNLGAAITLPNSDPNAATPNLVDEEDYTFWKANYGFVVGQAETEFRNGSIFFDTSLPGGGALGGVAAVPEPSAALMLLVGVAGLLIGRRRSGTQVQSEHETHITQSDQDQLGVRTMSRRRRIGLAVAAIVCMLVVSSAQAATGGIRIDEL